MAEKKYFWMKLHHDFFSSKRIKKMLKMENGAEMLVIYFKMQLKALETDAQLYFDNVMGDFAEELALDIDADDDLVRKTIEYLLKSGLLEVSEDGSIYTLCYLQSLINSDTAEAIRQRRHRAKALHCHADVTHMSRDVTEVSRDCHAMSQNRNGEIDIEKEKDKEIEKEIEGEKEEVSKRKPTAPKPKRETYGEYKHVKLTKDEFDRLCNDFGELQTLRAIRKVDEYCQETGKTYKDYNLTIRRWGFDNKETKKTASSPDAWADAADRLEQLKEKYGGAS
jgi:predicted phage replisome organizer